MLFEFEKTNLERLWIIKPKLFEDNRGSFFRVFCKEQFSVIGFNKEFVQINHSINTKKGTIRGLHFQKPPYTETKLVRCIKGKIMDVVLDIRENSDTFLNYFSVELSEYNKKMLLIPDGFAHGFQTLEDDTQVLYYHTNFYAPNSEGGIRYDDPYLNIAWAMPPVQISERDKSYPLLDSNFKGIKL